MYQKPVVERFGSFRNLTQAGGSVFGGDGYSIFSAGSSTTTTTPTVSVQTSRS